MPRWRSWLVLGLGLAQACSPDSPTTPSLAPSQDLALELTDIGNRIQPSEVNAHLYGSFRVAATAAGGGVITSGLANFPGHPPAGPGTCVDGKWFNAQDKGTSGTLTKPHPHCFRASAAIEVVLEPISACFQPFGPTTVHGCLPQADPVGTRTTRLTLDNPGRAMVIGTTTSDPKDPRVSTGGTSGSGAFKAYAIDAATLGTTNRRVGVLNIDLSQYSKLPFNVFDLDTSDGCAMDATIISPCLNLPISATYNPLPAPNGVGPTDLAVEGFLWLTPASSPYNYLDDPNYVFSTCLQQFADLYNGGLTNVPLGDIFGTFDAEIWCQANLAEDVPDCRDRLIVLASLVPNDPANPCFPAA